MNKLWLSALCLTSYMLFLTSCSESKVQKEEYRWSIIAGFPKPQVPESNPMSQAKVDLGRAIFYDNNLSFNRQQSCSSCHHQAYAFGENIPRSKGSTGEKHRRNSPALVNIAYNKTLTWAHDGLTTLERQILLPMFGESPVELGITGHEEEVLARFELGDYPQLFNDAFPEQDISFDLIVKALSSFVRSLISLNSPFDQYAYANDDNAISESALRGMNLFFSEKLECHHCHGGFNFTQSTSHEKQLIDRRPFHNTGLYYVKKKNAGNVNSAISRKADNQISYGYPEDDPGLSEITTLQRDDGRFRAPTLRNIDVSAPYMHDGSIETLAEVLDFYAAGGRQVLTGENKGDGRDHPLKSAFIKGFDMSKQDKNDLLAFLKTLTDQQFLTDEKHADPNK